MVEAFGGEWQANATVVAQPKFVPHVVAYPSAIANDGRSGARLDLQDSQNTAPLHWPFGEVELTHNDRAVNGTVPDPIRPEVTRQDQPSGQAVYPAAQLVGYRLVRMQFGAQAMEMSRRGSHFKAIELAKLFDEDVQMRTLIAEMVHKLDMVLSGYREMGMKISSRLGTRGSGFCGF
ncbi:hypothetical protein LTR95_008805 [Oleoguttula sp. CCFEE 5521]